MTAKTKAPTTSLIKCTPDITRTQAMIAARTASKIPVNHKGEAEGEHIKCNYKCRKNMPARKRPAVGILWNDRRHIKFFVWTWSVYDISENRYCNKADKRSND